MYKTLGFKYRKVDESGRKTPVRSDGCRKRTREAYVLMLLRGTERPGPLAFGEEAVPRVCGRRHQRPNVHFSISPALLPAELLHRRRVCA